MYSFNLIGLWTSIHAAVNLHPVAVVYMFLCVLHQGVVNTKAAETCTVIGVNKRTILFHPVQDLKNTTDFRFTRYYITYTSLCCIALNSRAHTRRFKPNSVNAICCAYKFAMTHLL